MVGKGVDGKTSRIFHQCYVKCCKLQNLTPLNNVLPSANGKVVDFCVDRVKYADWAPILNALSCDLSLHSLAIRCRQPIKTVLEHIDCDRLAKTVNKRAVILTKFMLSNMVEATVQMLANTTLLATLVLEGLPLRVPYLTPLCEVLPTNSSLNHLYLPGCLLGDAGCLAVCKAVRSLPNILTLDLSGCELTSLGAGYLADLIKYQKIHRYSENWMHTLRYRTPELDAMAGLRRLTLCSNPQLGDAGLDKLLDVLADDLWIKALDVQNCGLTELIAESIFRTMQSNTTLVVLDLRHNPDVPGELISKVHSALRSKDRDMVAQFDWLANGVRSQSDIRVVRSHKNGIHKDRVASLNRNTQNKYVTKTTIIKKEKDFAELLQEQLQEEVSHRQQLEELNLQLVQQMQQLKQQQLWTNGPRSSGSEQSVQASSRSGDCSSSSGSSSSVPIDQNTLYYIQQAFKDIYTFIKNNQCDGQCVDVSSQERVSSESLLPRSSPHSSPARRPLAAKKAASAHRPLASPARANHSSQSAHTIGDQPRRGAPDSPLKLSMVEKQMGDVKNSHVLEDMIAAQNKHKKMFESGSSPCSSGVSDSSETLCEPSPRSRSLRRSPRRSPPRSPRRPNPRDALCSSDDDDDDSA